MNWKENQTETVATKTSINMNDNDEHREKKILNFSCTFFLDLFLFYFFRFLSLRRFFIISQALLPQTKKNMFTKFINLNFKKLLNAMQMER